MADFELSIYAVLDDASTVVPFRWLRPEIVAELDRLFPLSDCPDAVFPSPDQSGTDWEVVGMPAPPPMPPVRLYEWFYPAGRSRWSVFRGIMSQEDVNRIEEYKKAARLDPQTDTGTDVTLNKVTFRIQCGSDLIKTDMILRPPQPISGVDGANGLYLITLVDARWLDQFKFQPDITTRLFSQPRSWQWTLSGVAPTIPGGIDPGYHLPEPDSPLFTGSIGSYGAWSDAVAAQVGRVICRGLDGTYTAQTYQDAAAAFLAARSAANVRNGGSILDADLEVADFWRRGAVPETVRVSFPKFRAKMGDFERIDPDTGQVGAQNGDGTNVTREKRMYDDLGLEYYRVTAVEVTATALGGRWANYSTYNERHEVLTTAKDRPDVPESADQIQALAEVIAKDYLDSQAFWVDESYRCVRWFDHLAGCDVLYRFGPNPGTRVVRTPRHWQVRRYWHAFAHTNYVEEFVWVKPIAPVPIGSYKQPCKLMRQAPTAANNEYIFEEDSGNPALDGWLIVGAWRSGLYGRAGRFDGYSLVLAKRIGYDVDDGKAQYIPVQPASAGYGIPGVVDTGNQYMGFGWKGFSGIYLSGHELVVPPTSETIFLTTGRPGIRRGPFTSIDPDNHFLRVTTRAPGILSNERLGGVAAEQIILHPLPFYGGQSEFAYRYYGGSVSEIHTDGWERSCCWFSWHGVGARHFTAGVTYEINPGSYRIPGTEGPEQGVFSGFSFVNPFNKKIYSVRVIGGIITAVYQGSGGYPGGGDGGSGGDSRLTTREGGTGRDNPGTPGALLVGDPVTTPEPGYIESQMVRQGIAGLEILVQPAGQGSPPAPVNLFARFGIASF